MIRLSVIRTYDKRCNILYYLTGNIGKASSAGKSSISPVVASKHAPCHGQRMRPLISSPRIYQHTALKIKYIYANFLSRLREKLAYSRSYQTINKRCAIMRAFSAKYMIFAVVIDDNNTAIFNNKLFHSKLILLQQSKCNIATHWPTATSLTVHNTCDTSELSIIGC